MAHPLDSEDPISSMRKFISQFKDCQQKASEYFYYLRSSDASRHRCALLGIEVSSKDVTYDDVFCARILYETTCQWPRGLQCIIGCKQTLLNTFHVSPTTMAMLYKESTNFASPRANRTHAKQLQFVATLSLEALVKYSVHLGDLRPNVTKSFVHAICGMDGNVSCDFSLPPYETLVCRSDIGHKAFVHSLCSKNDGSANKLTQVHGSAWNSFTNHNNSTQMRTIDLLEAHKALASLSDKVLEHAQKDYIDVALGYTQRGNADDGNKATPITVKQVDFKFGENEEHHSRAIGIYGNYVSPNFEREFRKHVSEELTFAQCPSGNRPIRVATHTPGQIFLIGNHVIMSVGMTPMEQKLVSIGERLLHPSQEILREYCTKHGLKYDERLTVKGDLLHTTTGPIKGTGYSLHNDSNAFLCDDMIDKEDLDGRERFGSSHMQVLTLVWSDVEPRHDISLEFYEANDGEMKNRLAVLDCHGLMAHYQGFFSQLAKHRRTPGKAIEGEGERTVLTIRFTTPFQPSSEVASKRLKHFSISENHKEWVTPDKYQFRADGSPILDRGLCSSIRPFPSIGSLLDVLRHTDPAAAEKRIDLPSDRWQIHPSARRDSDVSCLLRGCYKFSVDRKTWEILASHQFIQEFIRRHMFVITEHFVKTGKGKSLIESVPRGPLLENKGEKFKLVPPTSTFTATQTAQLLKLVHKNRIHQIVRNDEMLVQDVYLHCLYRNDCPGLLKNILFWKQRLQEFHDRGGVMDSNNTQLRVTPPTFWIGSSGGGAITSSEKGCPSFGNLDASKHAPDGFMAGGQKDTVENEMLNSVFNRYGILRVFLYLDPDDPFVSRNNLLPKDAAHIPVALYVDTVEIVDLTHQPDSREAIQEDLRELDLPPKLKKYTLFRTMRHTKYHCRSLLTAADLYGNHEWTPLYVTADSSKYVTMDRPSTVPICEGGTSTERATDFTQPNTNNGAYNDTTTMETGNGNHSQTGTRTITLDEYLANHLTVDQLRETFFKDKLYEDFLSPGGENLDMDEQDRELQSVMQLDIPTIVIALMHASVVNFARLLRLNLYPSKDNNNDHLVGYLSGPTFSALSSVTRLHSVHSPVRSYDLNTLVYITAMNNTLQRSLDMSPAQVRAAMFGKGLTDIKVKIMELAIFGTMIVRFTGRPLALEQFCEFQRDMEEGTGETSSQQTDAPPTSIPYFPTTEDEDVESFVNFLLCSCTDILGRVSNRMPSWTGSGDKGSIPPDLQKPRLFCSFLKIAAKNLPTLAKNLCDLAEEDGDDRREKAVQAFKSFIESYLQKDKINGSLFKANQVCNSAVFFPHYSLL